MKKVGKIKLFNLHKMQCHQIRRLKVSAFIVTYNRQQIQKQTIQYKNIKVLYSVPPTIQIPKSLILRPWECSNFV